MKEYFKTLNVSASRLRFRISSFMTPSISMNFHSDKKFAAVGWVCPLCSDSDVGGSLGGSQVKERDTQQHVLTCPEYEDLRHDKELDHDDHLVDYFRHVIVRRGKGGGVNIKRTIIDRLKPILNLSKNHPPPTQPPTHPLSPNFSTNFQLRYQHEIFTVFS